MLIRQGPLLILVLMAALSVAGQSRNSVADMSQEELNAGLFEWIGRHPAEFPRESVVKIHYPMLDLYSADGISIYYDNDAERNAAFIRALPKSIAGSKVTAFRPTLKEAIEMVPEFKKQEKMLLAPQSGSKYTAFIFTFPDWDRCKPQNDAVTELRKRAQEIGVRILEVRLH